MIERATRALVLLKQFPAEGLFVAARRRAVSLREYRKRLVMIQLLRSPRSMVQVILGGSFVVTCFLLIILLISFAIGNSYVLPRMLAVLAAFLYLLAIWLFVRAKKYAVAAWMLIALYTGLAVIILASWSINAPIGILTMGFVIILAGVMLGARYIIPVTVGLVGILVLLQLASSLEVIRPDHAPLAMTSSFFDVASYGTFFIVFALISWLSGRQMEQALKKALEAEAALAEEKRMLAIRLEEKTQHLREVQMAEMRQLYRFAELGQLSTAVMHELANYLTVLTLDVDDLQQDDHSVAIARIRQSIDYLETMVGQVRRQLRDTNQPELIDVLSLLTDLINGLRIKAAKEQVTIDFITRGRQKNWRIMGDPLRLSQIVTILVTNAIEAYRDVTSDMERKVTITLTIRADKIYVTVMDHGGGIAPDIRKKLFEPFRSTKKNGMGVGLFIARKMAETHFKGTIALDRRQDYTAFVVTLPRYQRKAKSDKK